MAPDTRSATPPPAIRHERGDDGVAVLTLDVPGRPVNVLDEAFLHALDGSLDYLEAERESLTGVVLTSAKKTFCAGADLNEMARLDTADAAGLVLRIRRCHRLFRRLERVGAPVVAALNGSAIGGGYELALACHHRIALDAPGVRIGLPEVTYGILPDLGGVTRSVRLFGIETALDALLLDGELLTAAEAFAKGFVDALVTEPDALLARARAWIADHPGQAQPWDTPGYRIPGGTPAEEAFRPRLAVLPAALRARTRGAPGKARRNILAAAVEGAQVDFDTALSVETGYAVELALDPVFGNLMGAFMDRRDVARAADRPAAPPRHRAHRALVIGAGTMGAAIAQACATAGIDVVLADVNATAAQHGRERIAERLSAEVRRGRLPESARDSTLARISTAVDLAEGAGADLVIEAVYEDAALKRRVLAEAEEHAAADALLASSASTLPIGSLADGVRRRKDLVGLNFCAPVDRTSLVEIAVARDTSETATAGAFDLAGQLGTTPILVHGDRGSFTSRLTGSFTAEALALIDEGVPAASVEQAALQAGFTPYTAGALVELRPGLAGAITSSGAEPPFADIQERLLFAPSLAAVRCVEEEVVHSPAHADVGSLLGFGFPSWTGGVLRYIDQYAGGSRGFAARADELAARYGARFAPPRSLGDAAHDGLPYRSGR